LVKNYFSDKVILITGGSSGLGKTFVDYFLKKKLL
jgi:NAD(P)-dependent dehydrogenase (short-subunit alcohol dehydrogenase family)